jgi:hypothetical protein
MGKEGDIAFVEFFADLAEEPAVFAALIQGLFAA